MEENAGTAERAEECKDLFVENRTSIPFVKDFAAGLENAEGSAGGGRKGNETKSKQRNWRELPLRVHRSIPNKIPARCLLGTQRIRLRREEEEEEIH